MFIFGNMSHKDINTIADVFALFAMNGEKTSKVSIATSDEERTYMLTNIAA